MEENSEEDRRIAKSRRFMELIHRSDKESRRCFDCKAEATCKWAEEKTILLPCVKGDELEIRYFDGREKLCPGEGYAIPEPVGRLFTDLNKIDVILVPGVAFDRTLNRLGRGKGFYDKILSQTKACKIGICFDFQLLDRIPTEVHDVRMTQVISSR